MWEVFDFYERKREKGIFLVDFVNSVFNLGLVKIKIKIKKFCILE